MTVVLVAIAACVTPEDGCELDGGPFDLPADVREASGVAMSRDHDGVLWIHNDSDGGARIFAVDTRGALLGTITLASAQNRDWEDIAIAPCPIDGPSGDCIYIADIGDNRAARDEGVGLWVLPEPRPRNGATSNVAFLRIHYPDGPKDAEAIVVTEDRSLILVSKGRESAISVYRAADLTWPRESGSDAAPLTLQLMQRLSDEPVDLPEQITGASLGPDGSSVALRSYSSLQFYRIGDAELEPLLATPIALDPFAEPQGEGVALGARGRVFLVSEAGPQGIAPRLTRLRCATP
ncbi:MAG TPA: hypothetical protein VMN78_09255 [Longimicrobiales bacterium]|nr:hypothetical protein [Longimicrobiales bacterium]